MRELKQSTAANLMIFMTDSADHVSGKTGLTLTITASKDGAAFGSITPTVTERGSGWYSLALTTSHTDTLGDFALHVTGTGADPADTKALVITLDKAASGGKVPATVAAADVSGNLPANVTQFGGANGAFSGGRPEVNTSHVAGTSQTARDLGNALPAATPGATGGLPVCDSQLNVSANTKRINGTAQTARDIGASVLLSPGTGTGQIDLTSGKVPATIAAGDIATDAITAAALKTDAANEIATAVWASVSRTLTAFGFTVDANAVTLATSQPDYAPAKAGDAMTLSGDLTPTMKSSVTTAASAATPAVTVSDKTGFALTSGYDAAKTAAQASDIPTANANADALLKRDWTSITGEAARSVLNALRFLRNKWSISGSTLTVTKEDDSTTAFTASMSSDSDAEPITGSDPS